jgi:hypothetical protein
MKIVIFGPERRLGVLAGDCVIDLNRGLARYLKQSGDRNPDAGGEEPMQAMYGGFGAAMQKDFARLWSWMFPTRLIQRDCICADKHEPSLCVEIRTSTELEFAKVNRVSAL